MNSEVTRLPSHTAAAEPHVADGVANGQACPNNVDIHAVETAGYRAQRYVAVVCAGSPLVSCGLWAHGQGAIGGEEGTRVLTLSPPPLLRHQSS